jgi:heme-degrading monooxygenase HmoA
LQQNNRGSDFSIREEIFRVDKFVVPGHAREEFRTRVHATHEVLRTQAGFVRAAILEQTPGPGERNFVTIVEWENSDAIEGAAPGCSRATSEDEF